MIYPIEIDDVIGDAIIEILIALPEPKPWKLQRALDDLLDARELANEIARGEYDDRD